MSVVDCHFEPWCCNECGRLSLAPPWGESRPESSIEHLLKLCFVTLLMGTLGILLLDKFLAVVGLETKKNIKVME
jgi:hypothetical protein